MTSSSVTARALAPSATSGADKGIHEISHDVTELRAFEGTQPLPGW